MLSEGSGSPGALVRDPLGRAPRSERSWRSRSTRAQAVLFVAPLLILLVGAWSHRWVTEDAFINFRIVSQTLAGHPFAFNAGERVEAGTSPLWIMILVAAQVLLGWAVDLAWLALLIGLAFSLFGVAAGMAGARVLARRFGATGVMIPAGALVLVVLPPMWDFSTSGLETGLTFGWLGGCFWALAVRAPAASRGGEAVGAKMVPKRSVPRWLCIVLGLGPLIRPDLTLFSVAFVVVGLAYTESGWARRWRVVAWAGAMPVAFEIFRAAYFATLVPNTALAKEATAANWSSGWVYLDNFAGTYLLIIPVGLLLIWVASLAYPVVIAHSPLRSSRSDLAPMLIVATIVAALLHGLFVIRVGGDFMHARLLLPAAFALLLPVAALPLAPAGRRRAVGLAAGAALAVWSVTCALTLRLPYGRADIRDGIADERAFWDTLSRTENAITLDDHAGYGGVRRGHRGRDLAARGQDVLILFDGTEISLASGSGVVLEATTIGLVSVAAGPDVRVIDSLGLADAIGSRISGLEGPHRIGHEKRIPSAWIVARVVPSRRAGASVNEPAAASDSVPIDPAQIAAARRALACPAVVELLQATAGDLTIAQLLDNVKRAPALTRLRIPADPPTAALCSPG